ncbi:hypothetical protein F5X68DRAFT_274942 [Plectosphaerella plurivora]|uniref:Uncharacterized protein n=1 Tax=Plectosphaerella plurivora TaxID=936078 RepID=A0A9P8VEN4_9PEZI|nr:hypothetical protein F5X68DRAFT_274942 [Plectosphaerella plurivora]
MDQLAASLKRSQKAKLHEVADGLLEVYRTLVRMRYLDASWIYEGPHDLTELLPVCEELALDPSIIYLYSILPYVDASGTCELDFFQGGSFIDYRSAGGIYDARDPFFRGDDRPEGLMRPWMTPLSCLGNHQTVIIYDARKHEIGMVDQESMGTTDHNIYDGFRPVTGQQRELIIDNGGGEDEQMTDEEEDEDEEDDDDEEEDEDEEENIWDEMTSRHARDVLCDMVSWYNTLTETPGGPHSGIKWEPRLTTSLYTKHGWPDVDFDGDAFLVSQARAAAVDRVKYETEKPLRDVEQAKSVVQYGNTDTPILREAVAKAENIDDEWLARWNVWRSDYIRQIAVQDLEEAETRAQRLCPDGRCFKANELTTGELERLRSELADEQDKMMRLREEVEKASGRSSAPAPLLVRLSWAEKRTAVYQQACDACEAEVATLPPQVRDKSQGRRPGNNGGSLAEWHTDRLRKAERDLEAVQEWLLMVPENALKARDEARNWIERNEEVVKDAREKIRLCAEHQDVSTLVA